MSLLTFIRPSPDEVVRDHGPMVHRQLKRIFGPQADVEDAFQNVFIEVLRSLPSFQGRSKLSTWIRRITWNVAYQEMRVQYRQPRSHAFDEERDATVELREIEARAEKREELRRLYAGLERLDPKQRMAIVLHDIEGLTLKEIGKALGRPLQTVASQLHAGRARLCTWMREETPAAQARTREKKETS